AAALAFVGLGLALAGPVVLAGASPRAATAYVLVVILGISLFVAAHYFKIVPFLVWYHRFGPLAGKQPVPRVSELYSQRAATAAGALLVMGVAGLTVTVALGLPVAARAAAVVLGAGVLTEAVQMFGLARRKP
ncbi:MAG: hypothetical protein ACRELX_13765, partial [Longimicrobiales bacterium]